MHMESALEESNSCEDLSQQPWVRVDEERWYYCLACKKNIDDKHLSSDAHARYLEAWRQEQRIQQDPELEFIALVPLDEQNPESKRALRCLLCQKWTDESNESHGSQGGSKEHQKNLREHFKKRSLWYTENVVPEKKKWSTALPCSIKRQEPQAVSTTAAGSVAPCGTSTSSQEAAEPGPRRFARPGLGGLMPLAEQPTSDTSWDVISVASDGASGKELQFCSARRELHCSMDGHVAKISEGVTMLVPVSVPEASFRVCPLPPDAPAAAAGPCLELTPHGQSFCAPVWLILPVCIGADKIYRSSHVGWDVVTSATFLHGFAVVGLNHFCTVFAGQPPGQRSDISVEAFLKPGGRGSRVKLLVSHARGCSGCMERQKTKMRRLEEDDYLPCMDGPADIDDFEDGQSLRYACFGPREAQATLRVLFNEIPHTSNSLVVAGENTRIDVNCVEEERGNPIVFTFNGAAELRPCTPAPIIVLDSTEGLSSVEF